MEIKEVTVLRGRAEIGPSLYLTYRNENNLEEITLNGTHISRFELRTLARELEKLADRLGMDVHQ